MSRLTGFAKVLIVLSILGGAYGIFFVGNRLGYIPTPGFTKASVPDKAVVNEVQEGKSRKVDQISAPSSRVAEVAASLVRGAIWEWNAQDGLLLANGGPETTKGSLMEKHGVNLLLYRQDDNSKMQEELIACAKEIHDGSKQCGNGANFVVIMGDGAGQFIAAVNPQLKKLGPEYAAVVIASPGYSRGEDAFMAPPEVKANPQAAKGLLCEGVTGDGDWNIVMHWAGDNGIKNNPDEKTWDPDAINWVNSSDYNVAAADYVAHKAEDRKVVRNGHVTDEIVHKEVNCVVTWSPGDVTIAQQRGGLVKVISSKEYRSQMPAVILGPKAFFEANHKEIVGLVSAMFEGGDQVRAYDSALQKASEISAAVYKDQDAAYWAKYYKGVVETDKQGLKVSLGGSAVNNLADNLLLFGLVPGANDNFKSVYNTFSKIVLQQYPQRFKDTPIPDVRDVEDKSYITGAQATMDDQGAAPDAPKYAETSASRVVSKRIYPINFEVGSAKLTPTGVRQLTELKDTLAGAEGLVVHVDGFTDSTENEEHNQILSSNRADAVKAFLQKVAPENYPDSRVKPNGHGSANPVATNNTGAGRALNRRVEISQLAD